MKTLVLLMLMSCATGYHKKGFSGGYTDEQVGQDMYEVSFNGNSYIGRKTIDKYLKRRCAELTKEKGFSHYVIVSGKETGYNKPGSVAVIKLLNNPPENILAYDADLVMKNTAD